MMQDAIMQWECVCAHNTQRNTASPPNIITKIHMQRVNIAEASDEKSLWREITENRRFVNIYIYMMSETNHSNLLNIYKTDSCTAFSCLHTHTHIQPDKQRGSAFVTEELYTLGFQNLFRDSDWTLSRKYVCKALGHISSIRNCTWK